MSTPVECSHVGVHRQTRRRFLPKSIREVLQRTLSPPLDVRQGKQGEFSDEFRFHRSSKFWIDSLQIYHNIICYGSVFKRQNHFLQFHCRFRVEFRSTYGTPAMSLRYTFGNTHFVKSMDTSIWLIVQPISLVANRTQHVDMKRVLIKRVVRGYIYPDEVPNRPIGFRHDL